MPEIPIRETCGACGKLSRIGFKVPDDMWREVVHPSRVQDPHCLECFCARADDKMVRWDEAIEFHPVSMATHLACLNRGHDEAYTRAVERAEKAEATIRRLKDELEEKNGNEAR